MKKLILNLLLVLALCFSVTSCNSCQEEKADAEAAVENAADAAEETAEDAADAVEEAADDATDAVEDAAEDVKDAVEGAADDGKRSRPVDGQLPHQQSLQTTIDAKCWIHAPRDDRRGCERRSPSVRIHKT